MGHDFTRVRVHTGPETDRVARSLNADAFTVGPDIGFAEGKYAPEKRSGKKLLGHELAHVVQQGASKPLADHDVGGGRRIRKRHGGPGRGPEIQLQRSGAPSISQAPRGVDPQEDVKKSSLPALEPAEFGVGWTVIKSTLMAVPGMRTSVLLLDLARNLAMLSGTTVALGVSVDVSKGVEIAGGYGVAFTPDGGIAVYGSYGGGGSIGADDLLALGGSLTGDLLFVYGGLQDFGGSCYVVEMGIQAGYGAEIPILFRMGQLWQPKGLLGYGISGGFGVEAGLSLRVEKTVTKKLISGPQGGNTQGDKQKEKIKEGGGGPAPKTPKKRKRKEREIGDPILGGEGPPRV
jgi:hypothetical protein